MVMRISQPYQDMDVSAATVQLNQLYNIYRLRHRPVTVARCVWWVCRLWPRLRWGTLPATLAYLDEQRGAATKGRSASLSPESVARTAGVVVRWLPRPGVGECLLRSLVIYALLRSWRQEETIEFVLGAGPVDAAGRPALHCWIEANGRPLLETADPYACFQVLWRHRTPGTPPERHPL